MVQVSENFTTYTNVQSIYDGNLIWILCIDIGCYSFIMHEF